MNGINTMTIRNLLNRYLNISNYKTNKISGEDIEFGRRTDEAIDQRECGFGTTMTEEEFLVKLESW